MIFDNIYTEQHLTGLNNTSLNKLFLTFAKKEEINNLIEDIKFSYAILYNKIFILEIEDSYEYAVTYNIEIGNIDYIPTNTIMVNRNKQNNILYTLNALNLIVKLKNSYKVDWNNYKNCILITQNNCLKQLKTKIHKIINL